MSRKYDNSRDVPTDTLVKRLDELSDAIAGGRDSQDREFTMRIPAECDRDADLVLAESARRLRAADTELAAAKARIAEQDQYIEHLRHYNFGLAAESCQQQGRIAALEKALEMTEQKLRKIKQGFTAKFADCMHFTSWANHIALLLKEKE